MSKVKEGENMRIAINASILDGNPTGLGIYTMNIITKLSRIVEDDLIVFSSRPEIIYILHSNNTKIKKIPFIVEPKYGKTAAIARFAWNQLLFPIAINNADIVYSTTHHGALCIFGKQLKQVVTVHDILPVKFPNYRSWQKWYYLYVLPPILKSAAAIITVSANTKRDLYEYYKIPPEKIKVIYNGVNHSLFKVMEDAFTNKIKCKYGIIKDYFLIIGASYPYKNVGNALRAFSMVSQLVPTADLVIVGGKKEYISTLRHEIQRLKIRNVSLLQYLPVEDIPGLYSGAKALIYPSLYEGFGLPPLEAMACGCPVIVSNTSSLPEVCGDAAYYIDPYSTESIAEAICKLARDENLRNNLRQKGLERAKLFTWDKTAQGVYEVLKAVYRERER